MRGLFTQETMQVGHAKDLVRWQLGDRKVWLYYPTTIKMAALIRVFAKAAVEIAGDNPRLWREIAKYEAEEPLTPLNPEYRRSGYLSNLKHIPLIDIEGELVTAQLDDLVAKFHCVDALRAQAMLTRSARCAKRWAGDGSRTILLTARLHNATPDGPLSAHRR